MHEAISVNNLSVPTYRGAVCNFAVTNVRGENVKGAAERQLNDDTPA